MLIQSAIFFMLTSTLVHPTALKLLLPKGSAQTAQSLRQLFHNCGSNDIILNSNLFHCRAEEALTKAWFRT
jgi:hypothetical protein